MKTVIRYGARIKELREKRGWTEEHLEDLTGVAARTIQRVESDHTKSPDTLAAIAAAFDTTVGDLGQRYRIAESKPATALMIETAADFGVAMQRAHHDYLIVRLTKTTDRVEDLISSITDDLQYISPDERDLFDSFLRSLHEPLAEMQALGYGIFSIQETRDRFMKLMGSEQVTPIENWTHGKVLIIPRHGCFRVGGPASSERLHRFNAACPEAIQQILGVLHEEKEVGIFANALFAVLQHPQSGENIAWCETCFPVQQDGSRLTMAYMAAVAGRTEAELEELLLGSLDELPIIGHA